MPKGGSPQGSGAIVLTADLVGLNQVLAAFGSPLIEKQARRQHGSSRAACSAGRVRNSRRRQGNQTSTAPIDIKG
jgi:hypothetical protein